MTEVPPEVLVQAGSALLHKALAHRPAVCNNVYMLSRGNPADHQNHRIQLAPGRSLHPSKQRTKGAPWPLHEVLRVEID